MMQSAVLFAGESWGRRKCLALFLSRRARNGLAHSGDSGSALTAGGGNAFWSIANALHSYLEIVAV